MSVTTMLLAEITKPQVSVTVEGIIVSKRTAGANSKVRDRVPINFTLKDVVGDTANVVLWDRPEEMLKINRVLRLGSAFRFASLRPTVPSPSSQRFSPKTTCSFVLQMRHWNVEKLSKRTEDKLIKVFNSPPQDIDLTRIPHLLSASVEKLVNLMALVVAVGEERDVILQEDVHSSALTLELADSSLQSIILTVWGQELVLFVKEQVIAWDSVILLQDALLRCFRDRGNQITTTSQTLFTLNVSGKAATIVQRAVEKARAKGFKPTKINAVPKDNPIVSPDLPPQWMTFKAISCLYERGVWPENIDPFKPMASILLFSNIEFIKCKLVCPKCDKPAKAADAQISDMSSTYSACKACGFRIGADCLRVSVNAHFSDTHGGMSFYLNDADLVQIIDCVPGTVEESKLRDLLQQEIFSRFVLVFQIVTFCPFDKSLLIKTIKLRRPTSDDWTHYLQVAE